MSDCLNIIFSPQKHFIKNYQLDITDMRQFDLVIDTTCLIPEMVCEKILKSL